MPNKILAILPKKPYNVSNMEIKKNFTLILGISIPIIMILLIAGSIYLPGLFVHPQYNFLYVSGDDAYYGRQQYSVQNGRLVKSEFQPATNQIYQPPIIESKLYIYNVVENNAREVTFEGAQNLNLDSSNKSPDDFEVVYGSRSDSFFPLFFYSETDYSSRYLKGHNVSKKLNLQLNRSSYYNNFRFLGWIK
jgi:hypothetical protein